ncbi:TRAP transporter substrate-binding protein [Afifella sp. IM 167]|uniref:TRAP transporter substrate-binding protein n=1 Tax=Afifella sp. IM 167 TaxID=2033586 RepID=UPI001CCFF2CF|nr:TRAP transporter substrate-binding protein [Afifella sp. IM 167]MBZ8132684.1 ABC transporter substrate-binding protein [Afifella sp. IM 167]
MDRRSFLKSAGLATGAAAASSLATPALSQNRMEVKCVTSWPKNFPGLGTAPEKFAEMIGKATDGRITVKVYGGGELVPPLKCNDAVQEGTAEMYHSADYYYQGKLTGYSFFCAVPFGFTPAEIDAWIQYGGGQELWDEVGGQFGIKHLPGGNSGAQMGGWFKKKMETVDDFKGLKMRIPGFGGDVINALGGTSVTLAGSEILPALQSGTIDATEWVGPWNDLAFGLYKVVKNYHYPGFHEPGSMLGFGINKQFWDGLPESDQQLFRAAALAVNNNTLADFNANNNQALQTLINDYGVELVEFSDDIYKEFGKAAKQVLDNAGNSDPLTKKVYESFLDFRKKAVEWTRISDQTYANKRALTPFS